MENEKSINDTIHNLLNRHFEIAAIKEHLLNNGYESEKINTAIDEVTESRKSTHKKQVTTRQGLRGLFYIVSGLLFLFSFLVTGIKSSNQPYNSIRLIVGIAALGYGIFLATRPLKDE